MSGGQDEAATQIETSEQKIDQRLITDEMEWRGNEIEVSNDGVKFYRRVFHTAAKGYCWCWGDAFLETLNSWLHARPIEKKWRVPTDEDVIAYIQKHGKRPACRVRDEEDDTWEGATLTGVCQNLSFKFYAQSNQKPHISSWRFCEIEDET